MLYQKNGCHHTYIYSKRLLPYLHLLNAGCRRTYIYSTPVLPYLHLLNACPAIPTSTQRLSRHTYIYSTPVATISKKEGGNVLQFMKSEESIAGEDSKPAEMCSKLVDTHFPIGKITFRWKVRSSKVPKSK